ncbi:MAG: TA system VapC family ribonuclease toxin [Thermoleophilaceae bacterium]
MSQTVDVNVLVYAVNEDAEEHGQALRLIERLGQGPEIIYLFWPTIMGFLRIATNPGILPNPLSTADATETIGDLLSRPHVRTPGEAPGFWDLYLDTVGARSRANDVPDAHLAGLMRQHGVGIIHTRDRGFRRFAGIEVRDPLT